MLLKLQISPWVLQISREPRHLWRTHNKKIIREALELLQQRHRHQSEDKLQDHALHQSQEDQQPLLLNLQICPVRLQQDQQIFPVHLQQDQQICPVRRQQVLQICPVRHQQDQEDLPLGAPLLPELMAHDPDQMWMPHQEEQLKLVHLHLFHLDPTFLQAPFYLWQSSCLKLSQEWKNHQPTT
jgi:hypothetical protein